MPMTPAQRKRISAKQFVFPRERKYPINTKKNAQSALSLAALHGAQMGGSKGKALIDKVYSAVIKKYPNLAESDSKTMKAYLRRNGRKNPGHAHLSYSDMNSDQRELYESLMLIAANDPVAYAARKPSQAVDAAFKEYQRSSRRSLQEDFLSIRRQLVRDLQGRYRRNGRKNPGHARKNPSLSHSMLQTHDVQGHKVDTYLSSRSGRKYSAFIVSEDFELPGKYSTRSGAVAAARAYLKRQGYRDKPLSAGAKSYLSSRSLTKAAAKDYRKMKGFVVKPQGWDELFDISGSSQQPNVNRQLQMQILNYRYTKAGFDKPAGFVYVPKTHAEVIDAVYQAGQEHMNAKDALLSAAAADNFADMALESMGGRKNPPRRTKYHDFKVGDWVKPWSTADSHIPYQVIEVRDEILVLKSLDNNYVQYNAFDLEAIPRPTGEWNRKNPGHARHNPITISDSDVLAHQAWHQMKYLDQIKELARQGGISRQEEKALIKQYSQLVGELDRADPEKYNVRESLHAYRRMKARKAARKNPGHAGFKDPFHRRDIGGVIVHSADVLVQGGEYAADIMKRKGKGYVYRFSVTFYPTGANTGTIVAQGTENTLSNAKAVVMRSIYGRDAMGTDRRRNPGHSRRDVIVKRLKDMGLSTKGSLDVLERRAARYDTTPRQYRDYPHEREMFERQDRYMEDRARRTSPFTGEVRKRKNPKRKPSKAVSDRAKLVKQAFALREKTGSRIKPQTIMKDPAGCIRRMKGKR